MADSGVPFAIGASNVPLVEDLTDIPVGEGFQVDILVTDLDEDDDPTSARLAIKAAPGDSDLASTTILKAITQTLTADGVITPTADPTVWRVTFLMTRAEGVQISRLTTFTYTAIIVARRNSTDYTRLVQRGAIRTTQYAIDDNDPLADGGSLADGSLTASGFDS